MESIGVNDGHVLANNVLPSPDQVSRDVVASYQHQEVIRRSRQEIAQILHGRDKRFLLFLGPCSIHDIEAGRDYARRLAGLAEEVNDRMLIVMRVYFKKPRTTVGWKGLIMDPDLDGSADIVRGLELSRCFLRDVVELGLPTATEMLDPITPQYLSDLVSWTAIGARTTESQLHRQMASGLSMPVGFKNGTGGDIQVAINAVKAAVMPHTFLGIGRDGRAAAIATRGNPDCHVILRGGYTRSNYSRQEIESTAQRLRANALATKVVVDCSHGNSNGDYREQPVVFRQLIEQIKQGNTALAGAMIESNINSGNQAFTINGQGLQYGVSVTDACIDWQTTESLVREAYQELDRRLVLAVGS